MYLYNFAHDKNLQGIRIEICKNFPIKQLHKTFTFLMCCRNADKFLDNSRRL